MGLLEFFFCFFVFPVGETKEKGRGGGIWGGGKEGKRGFASPESRGLFAGRWPGSITAGFPPRLAGGDRGTPAAVGTAKEHCLPRKNLFRAGPTGGKAGGGGGRLHSRFASGLGLSEHRLGSEAPPHDGNYPRTSWAFTRSLRGGGDGRAPWPPFSATLDRVFVAAVLHTRYGAGRRSGTPPTLVKDKAPDPPAKFARGGRERSAPREVGVPANARLALPFCLVPPLLWRRLGKNAYLNFPSPTWSPERVAFFC